MKSSQIIQRTLIESYIRNNSAKTAEYMRVMNENFVIPFNKTFTLLEAEMTAQQIQNAFGAAEKIATAGGDNRTLAGKGADAAGALGKGAVDLAKKGASSLKDIANKILSQNKANFEKSLPPADAGEVPNFEQQATQAAEQIQDPKAKQSVMDLIKQGLKNPLAQTLILTAVGGIATVVAGPAIAGLGLPLAATAGITGAVVGGLTGLVRGKLQGKGWKDAGMDALKGAGMGGAAGLIGGGIAQAGQAAIDAYKSNQQHGAELAQPADSQPASGASLGVGQKLPDGEVISGLDSSNPNSGVTITRPDGSTYTVSRDTAQGMTGQTGISPQATGPVSQGASSDPAAGVTDKQPMTLDQINAAKDSLRAGNATDMSGPMPGENNNTVQPVTPSTPSDGSYQQAAPIGRDGQPMKQVPLDEPEVAPAAPAPNQGRLALNKWRQDVGSPNAVKESIVYIDKELTARMWILHESVGKARGPVHLTNEGIADMFKKAGSWLKTKASNLTNKVTADKLQQAWTKAGSPTDSGQVAAIMAQAGVPQETIDQVFQNLGLPQGSSAPTQLQQPAQSPKQGMLGKAAGAIGGAIGGVKGAIAGTKDAFAKGKETGFDTSRAKQAGDAVGATGQQNPYSKSQSPQTQTTTPSEPTNQQPQQTQQSSPTAATSTQSAAQQTQTSPAPQGTSAVQQAADNLATGAKKGGNALATGIGSLAGAVQAGVGMGAAGQSLMYPKAGDSVQKITDKAGKEHQYKKVGDKWVDMATNKEVDPATAAMLDKQKSANVPTSAPATAPTAGKDVQARIAKQLTPTTTPQQPIKIGGQTLDPNNPADAKIIAQVQQQQGSVPATPPAQQPAQQPAQTAAPSSASTVVATNPEEIRKAKQTAAAKVAQAQMAANPAPTPAATPKTVPNFGQMQTGYSNVKMNAPTGAPTLPAAQPTTGAKAVPTQTASAQADAGKPGFLQSKLKGRQPVAAGTDFSAMLARKAKIKL